MEEILSICAIIISMTAILISLDRLKITKKDSITKNRPYLFIRDYKYSWGDGAYNILPRFFLISINTPARMVKKCFKLYDNQGGIFEDISTINEELAFHVPGGEHTYTFQKLFFLIAPKWVWPATCSQLAEWFRRRLENHYVGLEDLNKYTYILEDILEGWEWKRIKEYST